MEPRAENIRQTIKESRVKGFRKKVVLLAAFILLAGIGYGYFGIISPVVSKPAVEKSVFTGNVTAEDVNYVVNELGAYKLHPSLAGEKAEIELVTAGKTFSVTTENGRTVTKEGAATDPDIRIAASVEVFATLLSAADIKAEIQNQYNDGAVRVDVLKDATVLALKGYKGIYDELQSQK